ncbi:hypothetical protein HHI36_008948, partial [Cryptolaemus montrouzieri]
FNTCSLINSLTSMQRRHQHSASALIRINAENYEITESNVGNDEHVKTTAYSKTTIGPFGTPKISTGVLNEVQSQFGIKSEWTADTLEESRKV